MRASEEARRWPTPAHRCPSAAKQAGLLAAVLAALALIALVRPAGVADASIAPAVRAAPAVWTATGSLAVARVRGHTSTLLPNGKVLVVGGTSSTGEALASAELYDPASGTWTNAPPLATARTDHTANLLGDGTVLVAGGRETSGARLASAELYNPASGPSGTWTATSGSMSEASYHHTATLLSSNPAESGADAGKVLIAGGCCNASGGSLFGSELYNPSTKTFSDTVIGFVNSHSGHTATLLTAANPAQCGSQCGMVLAVGGRGGTSPLSNSLAPPEIYEPRSQRWVLGTEQRARRWAHTATLLEDGRVLIAGGTGATSSLAAAELYDPVTASFAETGSLNTARTGHAAVRLSGGKVLAVGGRASDPTGAALPSAELYDPANGRWTAVDPMLVARAGVGYSEGPTATLLTGSAAQCGANCGKVLVVGGTADRSTELYGPPPGSGSAGGGPTDGGSTGGGFSSAPLATTPGSGAPQTPGGVSSSPLEHSEAHRAAELRACLAKASAAGRSRGSRKRLSPRARRRAAALQRAARRRCLRLYGRTPGRITGLSARALSATKIAVTFVAPGTDGSHGPAARSYVVKQALRSISGSRGFARARSLCGGACRLSAMQVGTQVTLTITGLRPRTTYYYAVAARDNVSGRLGPRSATVKAKTR